MIARKTTLAVGLALLLLVILAPTSAQGAFGIGTLSATATNQDGSVDLQAGSHPYEYTVKIVLNHDSGGVPEGVMRDLFADLPAGFIGNPTAVPRCSGANFEGLVPSCPGNTQIGRLEVKRVGEAVVFASLYNLVPPRGVPASIGTSLFGVSSFQEASLRSSDYGLTISDITLPTNVPIQFVKETVWGTPSDPSHDAERVCRNAEGLPVEGCSSDVAPVPFLTLPTSCTGPLKTTVSVDSVEDPAELVARSSESVDSGGNPAGLSGCTKVPFAPAITAQPETTASSSPSGFDVDIHLPQTQNATQPATAHLRDATVILPRGLALNPSIADGLTACALEGPEGINLSGSTEPAARQAAKCPPSSKVGTVEVDTPILDHPLPGTIYVARQFENPFHTLVALYIAIEDPLTGVIVKVPGKVEPDPATGQLRATFVSNPQVPFEDLKVNVEGGPRAPLTTPSVCGTYTSETDLTPWSTPEGADASPRDSFQISGGARGGPCPRTEAEMPNAPSFEAGTTSPLAGTYSPFVLRLSRENGSQQIRALNVTLPPGLTGKLAGLQECSDAQIVIAEGRNSPGDGALEKTSPSCPAGSEIGVVNVGAGSGSPLYVQGHAYLAGPYKGAPLSMVIITPAVAGPFDLGVVAVRSALFINESTAQITVKSDQIPTILQGIPLDVRSIAVQVNRNQFTLNPTSCEPMSISGEAISPSGVGQLSQHFQVGGCKGLEFKPKLAITLKGGTKRNKNPALTATVTYPKGTGYANIARAQVTLPHAEFLDQSHIKTVCTRVQFAAKACPKASIYGKATATTPLLDKPLSGPVYLRSSSHKLPDLVAELNGQIDITLDGKIDTGKGGGIRNTFEAVPDAPVSKFTLSMQGGKKGLLVNSENICSKPQRAAAHLVAQNGMVLNTNPLIANSCGKKKAKKSSKRLGTSHR